MTRDMTTADWQELLAPSLAQFERIADVGWRRLPERFREMCGDLVIRVEDFASDEILDSMDIEDAFDLMGLYQGVSLVDKSASDVSHGPNMVFLYRRPILDMWSDGEDTLGDLITHVLVHEIGHHFGLSDQDMEEIEDDVAPAS